ncbi:MAG TPA: MFS transporter [Acidimicrobiales bacterium]|nr:MFS transporter [Acidimicrobiales bacterium]
MTTNVTADTTGSARTVRPGLALAVIATAQLMVVLDATIVNIALPHIHTALGFSQTGLAWVLNAYTLVFGGLLLLGGRSGDLFGRRRMFVVGVSLFAAASLLGGLAPTRDLLLAARALQGVGGAIASPTALSLVASTFEEGEARNRAFGVYAAVSGAGSAVGLVLGGLLVDYLTWRWVLFVNVPIGLVLALVAPMVLPESVRRPGRLDLPGALSSVIGMAALTFGFIHAASNGWSTSLTVGAFALAVAALAAFVAIESRVREPIMPLRLFRNRTRVGSYAVMMITGAAVFAMFYFLTQYVQEVEGFSALKAGFVFLPVSAVIVVVAQIVSRVLGRVGAKPLITAGTVAIAGGLLWLSQLTPHSGYLAAVLPPIALIAAGMGLIFVPITVAAVAGVEQQDSGIASAMLNVGQQVGGTIGLSALVTVFATGFRDDRRLPFPVAFTHGADLAFLTGALFMVAGLVATLLLIRTGAAPAPEPAAEVAVEAGA